MIRLYQLTSFRGPLTALFALVTWGLTPSSANADLTQWSAAVNTGSPPIFMATHIFTPSIVDIGALSGDITYEFIVNGAFRATAGSLIGSLTGGQSQAIRFDQFLHTNTYGVTQYGVADYDFGVPTTYDADVHLAFVVHSGAGTTALFVNGLDTGATVPLALTLHGPVAFGGTDIGGGNFLGDDSYAGRILGFADYNAALSSTELKAHADAFFAPAAVPELPALATWTMLVSYGIAGCVGHRWPRRKTQHH